MQRNTTACLGNHYHVQLWYEGAHADGAAPPTRLTRLHPWLACDCVLVAAGNGCGSLLHEADHYWKGNAGRFMMCSHIITGGADQRPACIARLRPQHLKQGWGQLACDAREMAAVSDLRGRQQVQAV